MYLIDPENFMVNMGFMTKEQAEAAKAEAAASSWAGWTVTI